MVHYLVKMPHDGGDIMHQETIDYKLETFNSNGRYLFFESGDEQEFRFLLLCENEDEVLGKLLDDLKKAFGKATKAQEINIDRAERGLLDKIKIARQLMEEADNYEGKKKSVFITESSDKILEKAAHAVGTSQFTTFLASYMDYISRTAEISAKSIYNVVLINDYGIDLDAHMELLYSLLATKRRLIEHTMIKGSKKDLMRTYRETRLVFVIEDDWKLDDEDEYYRPTADDRLLNAIFGEKGRSEATQRSELFNRIRDSGNIYITSMSQEDYERMSELDLFTVTFPHAVHIGKLSKGDKLKFIHRIAGEYGFAVDGDSFDDNQLISAAPMDKIEIAVRRVVQQKLLDKDRTFVIGADDLLIDSAVLGSDISAFDELERLIGLGDVKKTIREIATFLEKRGRNAVPCLHMAFLGNPGTGKTTVARILARLFAEIGLTKKDLLVETQRGGLVGKYLGHTAQKTAAMVKSAIGGVLFVDEAYALIERDDDAYGKEAVATLVKLMEDMRDEFVCILAGYTDDMNAMLDVNPGLRDRIQFHIEFPDYDLSELMQIFELFCQKSGYDMTGSATVVLKNRLARILDAKPQNFSNGRLARKIFERVRIKQAVRASDNTITEQDIKEAFAEKDIAALLGTSRVAMGFQLSA